MSDKPPPENLKEVEAYAAAFNAWFNTALEHDKSLLALSAGGIGLLLTLVTTVGLNSVLSLCLYFGALFFFATTIIAVLFIFRKNRVLISEILLDEKKTTNLKLLDNIALVTFGIGVVLIAILGTITAHNSYIEKGKQMSKDEPKKTTGIAMDSFEGLAQLMAAASVAQKIACNAEAEAPTSNAAPLSPIPSKKK
ncbi:MAG: hypothetical protein Q8K61_08720 [Gallionella sp.]|nr:hypothetical protein [Gallionella sp.]